MKKKIKLNNCSIDVITESPSDWAGGSCMGQCNLRKGTIRISSEMPKDIQDSTFVHELVHMIANMGSVELDEMETDAMANGILSYLKDNKKDVLERFYG